MNWHQILREADDCDALYDSGIARVGQFVYIRLNNITTRSDHETDDLASWAYIDAQPIVDRLI